MTIRLSHLSLGIALLGAATLPSAAAGQSRFVRGDKPFAAISHIFMPTAERDSLVDLAREQLGTRYRWGASSPGKAFDCSGLVQWLMANFDISLPRTSREQSRVGRPVARDTAALLPGDLLFFGTGRVVDHVGIYIGDGHYIHASNSRKGVIESTVPRSSSTWWKAARRLFTNEEELPHDLARLLRSPIVVAAPTGV